jgi:hypothetical protein
MQKNTPMQFVIQLGALLALYASLTSLIILIFSIINILFPDASYSYEVEVAQNAIRAAIAILVVFFPTYVVLTRLSNQSRRADGTGEYLGITRWLIYFSLLVGAGVMLIDLVTLITYFLNGEVTSRFLYKVFSLLFIVGASFHYYLLDVRGYFLNRPEKAAYFGIGAIILVIVSIGYGYQYIDTPAEVRAERLDEVQVNDLRSMQSYVENYFLMEQKLPASLEDAYGQLPVPTAPEGREAYRYVVTGVDTYELCASFGAPSPNLEQGYMYAPDKNQDWTHNAGDWCFDRIIIPVPNIKPLPLEFGS